MNHLVTPSHRTSAVSTAGSCRLREPRPLPFPLFFLPFPPPFTPSSPLTPPGLKRALQASPALWVGTSCSGSR